MKKAALIFTAVLLFCCVAASIPPARGEDGAPQALKGSATMFELKMRILEGSREKPLQPAKPVTASFLKFQNFINFDLAADVQAELQIKKLYNLKDLSLVTEDSLVWEKGKTEKAIHMFRLNGQEYLVMVTPGRLIDKNQFRIEVYEQAPGRKTNLLDTEFSLPDTSAAVFGFEDTALKPYFISLRIAGWGGVLGGVVGGVVGGVSGGVAGGVLQNEAGSKVMPPKLIAQVDPVYPEVAKKASVEGVVILEATTDIYGKIADIKVLRSIPLLDQAAIDAVRQWVYEPMVVDGKPKEVTFTVTVNFSLDAAKKPAGGGVVGGVVGGVSTGVSGGVEGGVAGGVKGGVQGGVAGGVLGGVANSQELKQFEGDAVRAVGDIKPPKLIRQVYPIYPQIARQARVEGLVIVEAKADEQGDIVDVRILRSIPLLDQAAIEAVRQWNYEPLVINGKPRKVIFTATVNFVLDEGVKKDLMKKFAAGAVRAEGDIMPPKPVKNSAPVYPEIARVAGVEGVVILGVKTNEEGQVVDAIILRSIPLLDQAAIDAVRQWVYEPLLVAGKAMPVVFTVTVRFQLKENVVRPGDTLEIEANGMPDLKRTCVVGADGKIRYGVAGDIQVGNRSLTEVKEILTEALRKFIKDPQVTVTRKPAKR
jgi:TonB family protein